MSHFELLVWALDREHHKLLNFFFFLIIPVNQWMRRSNYCHAYIPDPYNRIIIS